jgi:tetratricopeptide (TPR) repeat protein
MWAYVRFVRRPKIAGYLLIVAFLALGLLSKPMLVTLPFVLLLLDYWPLDRLSSKRGEAGTKHSLSYLLVEKVPLFVMVLASCIITFINQKKIGAMSSIEKLSLFVRLANASISYMQYIIKMIWPSRLAVFYPHPRQNVSFFVAAISAVVLLVITIFIFRLAKRHRYLVTGWFWYIGTLVPVIGFVQVGEQAMADRYTYIPFTGLFIIIAWGFNSLLSKWKYRKITLGISTSAILSIMAVCTWVQTGYWRNTITLFQHALDVTTDNYRAHSSIEIALYEKGRLEEAVYHCSEAIRIRPDWTEPMNNLAWYLAVNKGTAIYDPNRAVKIALRACELTNYKKPEILDTLAAAYAAAGDFDKAVDATQKALDLFRPGEQQELKKQIKSRLALFKIGKPYIEPRKY